MANVQALSRAKIRTHHSYPISRSILVVDNDRTMRLLLEQQLRGLGYETKSAADGSSAMEVLERSPQSTDVIVLDKALPGIDGAEIVRRCQVNPTLRAKPIIILTGSNRATDVKMSIDAGVFYYLVKPVSATVLQSVIASAFRRVDAARKLLHQIGACRNAMSCVESARFEFRTPSEVRDLATLLSGSFPNPERAILGISELMINSIEHGNLEIGFERKCELVENDELDSEIERRLALPKYACRRSLVLVARKADGTYIVVTDSGPGFNPKRFINLDPARSNLRCGRGLAQARAVSFDKLRFNAAGNQVVGFMASKAPFDW